MKAKWILSMALAAAVSAPAFAITPLGDNVAPATSTSALRPVVQGDLIAWGDFQLGVDNGSWVVGAVNMYDVGTATHTYVGSSGLGDFPADFSEVAWVAGWAPWTPQIGLEGDYLYYNSADSAGGGAQNGAMRYQISTGTFTKIGNPNLQWHFADGNAAGLLAIQDWAPNMAALLIDPATFAATDGNEIYLSAQSVEFGTAPRISGNTMAWQADTATDDGIAMYDIGTGTTSQILNFTKTKVIDLDGDATADKALAEARFARVSNDGSKIVTWVRHWDNLIVDDGPGSTADRPYTSIRVYDVGTGTWTTVVDQEGEDEQPFVDGDYVVWERRNPANGDYDVMGMHIPSGSQFLIDGGATQARYPVVDGTSGLIAWAVEGINGDVNQREIHYTWVPEPASLSLLALGGLALARRRR